MTTAARRLCNLLLIGLTVSLVGLAQTPVRPMPDNPTQDKKKKPDGHTGTKQSSKLYTAPDAGDPGGLRGRVAKHKEKLIGAFAIPAGELVRVYKATLSPDGHAFEFNNLPTAKFDLLLLFPGAFYEGITLSRAASTLVTNDWKSILGILGKSEPFYEIKRIQRMEGASGTTGWAQGVVQEVRERPVTLQDATVHTDIQIRAIKLVRFENVGPAWQLLVTREIARQEVAGQEHRGLLPHGFCPDLLGNLRVVDTVKDLGLLDLPQIR